MPSDAPSKMIRIRVGATEIRVEQQGGTDIPNCDIKKRNDLQFRTTLVLVDLLRQGRLNDRDEFQILGENLYKILFDNKIGAALKAAFDQPLELMRVELEFEEGEEELSSLPWEYVYLPADFAGGGYFLAEQRKVVLTRRLRLEDSRPMRIDKPPLKVLFVASSPKERVPNPRGQEGETLDYKVEYEQVLEVLRGFGSETIKVTSLLPYEQDGITSWATWQNFIFMLQNEEFHAIHFLGHGKWDGKKGTILFMRKDGSPDPVPDSMIANALMGFPSLRLVFLQACESAYSDPYQVFSGVAQQLAQKKIPAVVGMQYKIHQQVANAFASEFYRALAERCTVDASIQKARWKIAVDFSNSIERLAFGLPVLYLRDSEPLFSTSAPVGTPQTITPSEYVACPWCPVRNKITDKYCGDCEGSLVCPNPNCKTRVDRPRNTCGECNAPLNRGKPTGAASPSTALPGKDKFVSKDRVAP